MTPIGPLLTHNDPRLRMVCVHRAWALQYQREHDRQNATVQFHAARELLHEARERRILRTGQ